MACSMLWFSRLFSHNSIPSGSTNALEAAQLPPFRPLFGIYSLYTASSWPSHLLLVFEWCIFFSFCSLSSKKSGSFQWEALLPRGKQVPAIASFCVCQLCVAGTEYPKETSTRKKNSFWLTLFKAWPMVTVSLVPGCGQADYLTEGALGHM